MTQFAPGDRRAAVRHAQRASGQVAALASMIAGDLAFEQVVQQVLAARGSLDSLLVRLIELEMRGCVTSREERVQVDGLLRTALGRGAYGRRRPGTRQPSAVAQSPARADPQESAPQ